MKYGYRKPSIKKSVSARTTGNIKRKAKSTINPLYGKKGMGYVNDPHKALYNKIYNKTTSSIFENEQNSFDNTDLIIWIILLVIFILMMWGVWSIISWLIG